MRPILLWNTLLALSLMLSAPALAGDKPMHGPGHGPGECSCGGMDPHYGPHDMHGGMHGGMMSMGDKMHMGGKHGWGERGPRRHRYDQGGYGGGFGMMHHGAMGPGHREFIADYADHRGVGNFRWHPNRLRAAAVEFMSNDVYRLAILPFNDISSIGPINQKLDTSWAERVLRDTIAGGLLETGIMVLPGENVEAAVSELKGYNNLNVRAMRRESSPTGFLFDTTVQQVNFSQLGQQTAENVVRETRDRWGISRGAASLATLGTDYTGDELIALADALDVDGFILGSITSWGVYKDSGLFNVFDGRKAELTGMMYVIDGATGQPIYGTRMSIKLTDRWWEATSTKDLVENLNSKFAHELLLDLAHPLPARLIQHIRHDWDIKDDRGNWRRMARRDDNMMVPDGDGANMQRWKLYTHHVPAEDKVSKRERVEAEIKAERELENKKKKQGQRGRNR